MNPFGPHTKVFLVLGATDMRKAIDGLALLVADHLERDAFSGHLFAFCNRGRTIIKILVLPETQWVAPVLLISG